MSDLFQWGTKTYLMGIINATPDSFSGDGLNSEDDPVQAAILLAQRLVADGAHLLDVGGESTRPGATPVSAETELNRVTPIIKALAATVEVPISIDTSKATVARSRKEDASSDERLGGRYVGNTYDKLIEDISRDLEESITIAFSAGIDKNQIILDPGIGFGKTVEQNLRLLNELGKLENLGYPLLIGPSRKSFIGYTLDLQMEDRLEGTAAAVAVGITRGADIVRVHDVREMVRVAQMTDALVRPVQD